MANNRIALDGAGRRAATLAILCVFAAGLQACGKKGDLNPPPGATDEQIQRSDRVIHRPDNASIEY